MKMKESRFITQVFDLIEQVNLAIFEVENRRTPWVLVARVKVRREASWLSQKIWELKEVKF